MKSKLFFLVLFLFWFRFAFSQSVNFSIYDTETGLPTSEVYSAFQSKNGLLWFTSDRGVFTYNGYNFKTYTTHDGLGNNTCFGIFEHSDGSIWFTGYDGSVSVFRNNKFTVHKEISDFVKVNYKNDWIDFCDFSTDKIYFTLARTKRLFEFDLKSKNTVECNWIYANPQGSIIDLGAHSYYLSYYRVSKDLSVKKDYHLCRTFKTGNDRFIMAKDAKVYNLVGTIKKLKITDSFDFQSQVQSKNLMVLDSTTGDFFAVAERGLFLCNFNSKNTIRQHIIKDININNIIQDHEGNFWAATFNKGVISIPSIAIKTYKETVIGTEKISSLLRHKTTLIAGSATGTAYFVEDENNKQSTLEVEAKVPIEQFYMLSDDYLLGLRGYKRKNGQWKIVENSELLAYKFVGYTKNSVLYSRQNSLYYFDQNGVKYLQPKSPFAIIKSICYAQDRVWVGTITSLTSARIQGDSIVDYRDHGKAHSILAQRVNDIKIFRDGLLLSVFGKGLVYFDGVKPIPILHEKIINENLINRILVLDYYTVLLLTNNGLTKIRFKNARSLNVAKVELFDVNDGLSSNFINDAYADDKTLWIATNKGVNSLLLSNLQAVGTPPPVNIVSIKTQDSVIAFAASIELSHYQNSFIVEFEGISFKKSNHFPFYKYCLLSSNKDTVWNYTNEQSIQFTNLPPGKYVFLLSARSKNSNWAPFKAVKITVHPYFTQTWWFRILCIILGILGIYLFLRVRIRNVKLKNAQQKKVEQLASRALETELMALRNQMNPHFVFNSLNSIQRFIITKNFADANNYITMFSKLMRTSLNMSKLEFISLDKEIEFISTYMDLEKLRFDNLFEYYLEIGENIDAEMTQIPTLLIQPLLENSIKHGFKNMKQDGVIRINISLFDSEHLLVEVVDNGKGIQNLEHVLAEKQSETSFGLGIVMQRIRLLKERTNDHKISFELINLANGIKASFVVPLH